MPKDDTKADLSLPLFYRVVLKFPKLSVESFSAERQGLFWAVGLPVFVICYVFLNILLLIFLSFPYNYVIVLALGILYAMFIIRILVERELSSKRAIVRSAYFRWQIDKSLQDYLHLIKNDEEVEKKPLNNDD